MAKARRASRVPPLNAGALLEREIASVLARWEETVRRDVPGARDLDERRLRNSIPIFLRHVVEFISTTGGIGGGERYAEEVLEAAVRHGEQRALIPYYALDQVILEYRALRRVIFDVLEQEIVLTEEEREKLLEAIDHGMVQAATEFAARRGFEAARLSELELRAERAQVDELKVERALRERFVSTLTHDLRTPLTAVRMSAGLITRQVDKPERVRELARRIGEDSERVDRMIRNLLDANRIEAGEPLPLKYEPCDLLELCKGLLSSLSDVHGDRFQLEATGDMNGVWSAQDLQRAIENLVLNGIKYGDPKGKIRISLAGTKATVTIAVHNDGAAIPPEQQLILFEPFKRSVSAQTSGRGGWGLGLILVKGIVAAHGGQVRVESFPDSGTTFTLSLPRDSSRGRIRGAA